MRAEEFAKRNRLKTYQVRLRLTQAGYSTFMDTQVQATTPEMARRMIRAQYNSRNVIVGQPRLIRTS
jgi:hypothetical protein